MRFKIIPIFLIFCLGTFNLWGQLTCETLDRIPLPLSLERLIELPSIPEPPLDQGTTPTHADRIVFWIHGLGGTEQSWAPPANASVNINNGVIDYDARQIISSLPDYTGAQNVNLDAAARKVQERLNSTTTSIENNPDTPPTYQRTNNFIITHSQGGLVSRWLDMIYENENPADKTFGGIATFGTSHGGAAILENEDLVFQLGADLCKAMVEPKVVELVESNFFLDIFANASDVSSFIGGGCDFFGNNGLPLLLAGQNQNITNDYHPDAPALTTLRVNDSLDNGVINKVAFFGVEEEPIIWRLLNGLSNKPEEEPVFTAIVDTNLVSFANREREKADLKAMEWKDVADAKKEGANSVCGFPIALFPPLIVTCLTRKNQYTDALNIWRSFLEARSFWDTANDKYKVAIGALEFNPVEVTTCKCEEEITGGLGTISYSFDGACPVSLSNCVTRTSIDMGIPTEYPSDGVVLMKSAIDYPNARVGEEMTGSNHQQMRNDENTRVRLNELWNGEHGRFFETPIKN